MSTHMNTHTHMHTLDTHIHEQRHRRTHIHTRTYLHTRTHTHENKSTLTYTLEHTHTYIHTHTHTHTHIHHTHTHIVQRHRSTLWLCLVGPLPPLSHLTRSWRRCQGVFEPAVAGGAMRHAFLMYFMHFSCCSPRWAFEDCVCDPLAEGLCLWVYVH